MACHANLYCALMTALLVFSALAPLEMGGASPVPTHHNKHNKNSVLHKGNAVRFQQRPLHHPPPIPTVAKNQHHKHSHVIPLPPSNLPLQSTTAKEDKLSLRKQLEDLLEAKLDKLNPRTPTVNGGYGSKSDRNQSRSTLPYLKGRTTPRYLKDRSRSGSKRSREMVTTDSSTPPPTTEMIATTTEMEEITAPTTTQTATTTETEETTTTTESVEVAPALTTTAGGLRNAMEFTGRKIISSLQNQLPSVVTAVTPKGRRFFFYPTYEGKVCIYVETGYDDFNLTVRPCYEISGFELDGCTQVPGHYASEVCDTTFNGVVCYDYTEAENVCLDL